MKGIKHLIIAALFLTGLKAQTDSAMIRDAGGKTLKRLGKSALKQNDPSAAVRFFEAYLRNNRDDADAMMLLGRSYNEKRDYEKAEKIFRRAYKTDRKKATEALFYQALMQKSLSRYDSARLNFQKFKKEYKGSDASLKRRAAREIIFCDSIQGLMAREYKVIIVPLDTGINKVNSESAPSYLNQNTLLFSSARTEKTEYITEGDSSGGLKKKIYYAIQEKDKWLYKGEFGGHVNDPDYNTVNPCFSPDRKRLYFSRCRLNYMDRMICAIYMSEKTGEEWGEPVKLPRIINNPKYSSTMPAIAENPKSGSDILYFVSDRKDGRGGMDIWYSEFNNKTRKFKEPKNAGSKVNTASDEISPFFDVETRTLYYSSDAPGGFGGFDVYKTTGDGKRWTGSENIGPPLNSGLDETYFVVSPNHQEGLFVSNRAGGSAIKESTCCDDIYFYRLQDYITINLKGKIVESLNELKPVPEASIDIYLKDLKHNEKILIKTIVADKLGQFTSRIEAGKEYEIVVKNRDHLNGFENISTMGISSSRDIETTTRLKAKPEEAIKIEEIHYEFGKSELNEVSRKAIDGVLLELMKANPDLIVEVQSHTDNKGNDNFNMKLSQKRADVIVKYLLGKGIKEDRLKAVGYGESLAVAPNEKEDGSDNPEGRALNRRTEFKIIGMVEEEELLHE